MRKSGNYDPDEVLDPAVRDYFQPTVETLGVVALHFPHGTLKISDPKPREELDVTAVVIDQAPVRGAIGEFAYVLYLHWASAQKGRVGATGSLDVGA